MGREPWNGGEPYFPNGVRRLPKIQATPLEIALNPGILDKFCCIAEADLAIRQLAR
jgi:hypothetical protein